MQRNKEKIKKLP